MVSVVLLLAITNLGLGFGLAVLLERPVPVPNWFPVDLPALGRIRVRMEGRLWRRVRISRQERSAAVLPARSVPCNEFPWLKPEWSAVLNRCEIEVASLPEAILWLASVQLAEWCEAIQSCERQTRAGSDGQTSTQVSEIVREFQPRVAEWSQAVHIGEEASPVTPSPELVVSLLARMSQRAQSVQSQWDQPESDSNDACVPDSIPCDFPRTFSALRESLDDCHETLAQFLRSAHRLESVPEVRLSLAGSQLLSRIGLAKLIEDWEKNDSEHIRIASVILIDLNHCQQLNAALGLQRTSEILSAVRPILVDVLRQGRGFDRVASVSGSSFLLFLGDTALRNATTGAERVRQSLQAARLLVDGEPVPVVASCAVAEWSAGETFDRLLERLRGSLTESKKATRNCTIVCDLTETRFVRSAELPVANRDILVGLAHEPMLAEPSPSA